MKNRLHIKSNIPWLLIIGLALFTIAYIFGMSCQEPAPAPAPAPEPVPAPEPAPVPAPEPAPVPEPIPAPEPGKAITELEIAGFTFVPETVKIPIGTTLTWTNTDPFPHTVTTREPLFDSLGLYRDETFSYTFNQSGTFEYYCTIHPYITGKVIVE